MKKYMVTISHLKLPKELSKKKKLPFIKAFIMKNGEEMKVNADIDMFAFTYEAAIQNMINSTDISDINDLKGKTINFIIFTIPKDELLSKPLVIDSNEIFYEDGIISISLEGKKYEINLEDKVISDIEIEINPKNEIKTLKSVSFVEE